MISLQKYISNIIESNVSITNELEEHFYCEFILRESFNHSFFNILEKYGSYIDQKQLIIDLSKEIYLVVKHNEPENKFKLDSNDLKEYSNIFFKELIIELVNTTSGYLANKSKYLKDEKLFDTVIINIDYNDCKKYSDLCSTIMHEMLHAYNEYKSYISNSPLKLKDITNTKSNYYKTLFGGSDTSVSNICKRIINNIRQFEQNAYLSELSTTLDTHKFNISKYNTVNDAYKQALEIFKNSDTWIQYSSLWKYITDLQYDGSEEDKSEFANTYNEINNTSLTYNKIYKKLDGLFNKILKRIETTVPKIFYQYYVEQTNVDESISGRQNNSLIKFIEFENKYTLLESVKPENGLDWEVYVNNQINKTFTEWAKKWKKYPKVSQGWYAGGTVFKIVKIEDNKVYTEEDKNCKP